MRKYLSAAVMAAVVLFAGTGCGYRIGFIKHPQLNSIAVAPAVNETAIYNAASDMRFMMNEVIMQDGTFKLSDQKRADAILYLTIQDISFADVSDAVVEHDNRYKPEEWQVRVTVDYKLMIPGQGKPLLTGKCIGSTRFQAPSDIETSRLTAVRQACYDTAKKITYAIAEGW